MIWKKKKDPPITDYIFLLKNYVTSSTIMMSNKLSNPVVRAGIQVHILGMTGMLKQAEHLNWDDFLSVYKTILIEFNLLPTVSISDFVNTVGQIASNNQDIEKIMRLGGQSMQRYIAKRDTNAPTDLLSVVFFSEKNSSRFDELIKIV